MKINRRKFITGAIATFGSLGLPSYSYSSNPDVIVIGANPTENHPVAATFFKNAAKNGSKLIVVDPRKSSLNKYAFENLNFRPGTDVALLNSIMNVIVKEKLYDQQYIKGFTEGFKDLKNNKFFHIGPPRDFDLFKSFEKNKVFNIKDAEYLLCTGLFEDQDDDLSYYKSLFSSFFLILLSFWNKFLLD